MKYLRRENTAHVNTGNALYRAPQFPDVNVFSKPVLHESDIADNLEELIGELNPELERMSL